MFANSILRTTQILLSLLILIQLFSCADAGPKVTIVSQLNPNNIAPLTALLNVNADEPCSASIKVLGESPIEQSFDKVAKNLQIPVVGLYSGKENEVEVTLNFGEKQTKEIVKIKTNPLPVHFPEIEINTINRDQMAAGMHGCDLHFANHGSFNSCPMIFDDQGVVRWYLDLSFNKKMIGPFQRLRNGDVVVAARQAIFEFDMLGKVKKKTDIDSNYGMHHDLIEMPDGNLLIAVGKRDSRAIIDGKEKWTDSDFLMLFDRKSSKIIKEWDFAENMDVNRTDINHIGRDDWLHMNSMIFLPEDSTIIMSGKNQGIAKVTWDNELKWIMAPKKNWGKSGRKGEGFDTKPFLLTAVDADGKPYPEAVQQGTKSAEDFDFAWGQHAPLLMPNGNLLIFDNGSVRNFIFEPNYSRAVEYKIDDEKKTVSQVWQYGKERGTDFFSLIISDVDYLPEQNNVLVTSGHLHPKGKYSAKIVEVDYETKKEVFEATLYYKTLNGNRQPGWGQSDILYRSERMELIY